MIADLKQIKVDNNHKSLKIQSLRNIEYYQQQTIQDELYLKK